MTVSSNCIRGHMTAGIRGNKAYRGTSHAEREQLASILLAALNFSHIRILAGGVNRYAEMV